MTAQFHDAPRALSLAVFAALNIPLVAQSVPVGSEFQANTFTTGLQLHASAAIDADGDFVVTWDSANQDGSSAGIYAQLYNAAGVARGTEFRVNTTTTDLQYFPAAAMDSGGNFVIVWQTAEGGTTNVYGQCYDASGSPSSGEFLVNTYTTSSQQSPSVAMDDGGDFAVVWHSAGQDGDGFGIFGQRFNAACVAQGGEFPVNTQTVADQLWPSVSMDADGDFVVTWEDRYDATGTDGSDVFGQRYNSAGVAQGSEFQVNTYTTSVQDETSVAMDAGGNFVVVWRSYQSGGDRAQRFNVAGVPQGVELELPLSFSGLSRHVAMDDRGGFVVVGVGLSASEQNFGIFGQRYAPDGTAAGGMFHVNTYTTSVQNLATVAVDADGDFVVAWESSGQDGSSYGIYGQRFAESSAPPDFNGDRYADIFWRRTTGASWFYLMKGAATPDVEGAGPTVSTIWSPQGLGDFNGDGRNDVFWRKASGATWFYLLDGNTVAAEGAGPQVAPAWAVQAVADFNGDGKDDIYWRRSNGATWFYLMDGMTAASEGAGNSVSLDWTLVGAGDFDGDGKDDLLWRKANGATWFYLMDGMSIKSQGAGNWVNPAWEVAAVADFNGDGKADIWWRKPATGATWFYFMDGMVISSQGAGNTVPTAWLPALVADFSGDGMADVMWRKANGATWFDFMDGASVVGGGPGSFVSPDWLVVDP